MNYKSLWRLLFCLLMGCVHGFAVPQIIVVGPVARVNDVIFINGIQNTLSEAIDSLKKVQTVLPGFRVSYVYNPIGWFDNDAWPSRLQDNTELFLLKTAEECFREDLRLISVPHNNPRLIDLNAANRVKGYLDSILPGTQGGHSCGNTELVASGRASASDMEATKTATMALIARVKDFGQAIVIAHSQGNLLANLAYAGLASEFGNDVNRMIRIVNVANTSELSVHGLDMTHSEDRALALLKLLPASLAVPLSLHLRVTPDCSPPAVCQFKTTAPTLGAAVQYGDYANHRFVETYLSDVFVPVTNAQGVSFRAGKSTFVDRFVDFVVAAANSLEVANTLVVQVTAASCTAPILGQPMVCTLVGSNLPDSVSFTASNCAPQPMQAVQGATASSRSFTCTPSTAGLPVAVNYFVPGAVGLLPQVTTRDAMVATGFDEDFSTNSLRAEIWNSRPGVGGITFSNGQVTFGANSSANTGEKALFAGRRIIVESRMAGRNSGRDTVFGLIDVANSGQISVGDTNYRGWGLYMVGYGNLAISETDYSVSNGSGIVSAMGGSTAEFMEYRLTMENDTITVERGTTLSSISQSMVIRLASTIEGRSFYLNVNTGDANYSPGTFDWIRVRVEN